MMNDLSAILDQENVGLRLKLYSNFPFANRAGRKLDQYAKDSIKYLTEHPDETFVREDRVNNVDVIRVSTADKMVAPACVACHNSSPDLLKNDWKLGEVRGVFEVTLPVEKQLGVVRKIQYVIFIVGVLTISAIGFFLWWVLSRTVSQPLSSIVRRINTLNEGEFEERLRLPQKDEIGELGKEVDNFAENIQSGILASFQKLAEGDLTFEAQGMLREPLEKANIRLNRLIQAINGSTEQIQQGSFRLSENGEQISQGATEQASALEEISSTVATIQSQSSLSANNADHANQLAVTARNQAENGNQQMKTMLESINQINEASEDISSIIQVIDGIAFQTNVLAINASVEAARAGQYGKGFAVVAEEVRSLAQKSASAARETTKIIQESGKKAQRGQKIANETASSLEKIVNDITKVTGLAGEISESSKEQARAIDEASKGLREVNNVIQQNAHIATTNATTTQQFSVQVQRLKDMVSSFKLRGQRENIVSPDYPQGSSNLSRPMLTSETEVNQY